MHKLTEQAINTFKERLNKLNLECLDIIDESFNVKKKYKLKDKNGYYHYKSSSDLTNVIIKNSGMKTFFYHNPYTYENINNYFKLNEIPLELLTKNPKNAKDTSLEFRCLIHNDVFKKSWDAVLAGKGKCIKCADRIRYNIDIAKEIVKSKGLEMISNEYKTINDEYLFRCECGEIFTRRFDVLVYQNRTKCHNCTGTTILNYEIVKEDLKNNDIQLLSNTYINNSTNIKIKYQCGFITERSYASIKNSNYECPHCNCKGYKRNTESFYKEIYELVGDEYTFHSEYIKANIKMKVTHNICGHTYEVRPYNFLTGYRCPYCSSSKSEAFISNYLKSKEIEFNPQQTFDGLIGLGGGLLRFDFALYNKDNKMFLIEYDGEYHYKPIEGIEMLQYTQEHDRRKNEYCKLHNITLYRIPYWERDVLIERLEEIIEKEGIKN